MSTIFNRCLLIYFLAHFPLKMTLLAALCPSVRPSVRKQNSSSQEQPKDFGFFASDSCYIVDVQLEISFSKKIVEIGKMKEKLFYMEKILSLYSLILSHFFLKERVLCFLSLLCFFVVYFLLSLSKTNPTSLMMQNFSFSWKFLENQINGYF